jgi:hypothetical protein
MAARWIAPEANAAPMPSLALSAEWVLNGTCGISPIYRRRNPIYRRGNGRTGKNAGPRSGRGPAYRAFSCRQAS